MTAILKHELRSHFHSLTSYVFGAFLLAFVGFGALLYNIQASVSNFEFVLGFGSLVFVAIIPILTMRSISDEKKQKTDQLLYSLPITTTQVVVGKYIALLIVFLLPLSIIAIYPLIFAQFGNVSLLTAYGALFAFFLTGSALIALGIFISSLTENQGLAAGIGIAVILFNYYSVSLAEHISSTAMGSLLALICLDLVVYFIIQYLTKHEKLAFAVSAVLLAIIMILFITDVESFNGLLPKIVSQLSLFKRLDIFVNGIFDLTAVVYFITFSGLFLFLSVQSLEKRRYN